MSGIFDLFNTTGNATKSQFVSGSQDVARKMSTTSQNLTSFASISAKNVDVSRPKPKGLSIRPNSDLNVNLGNLHRGRSPSKKSPKKQFLKPGNLNFGKFSKPISPQRAEKNPKLQALKFGQMKAAKTRSPQKIVPPEEMQIDANVFKKPSTPRMYKNPANFRVYPEPEKLAGYCEEDWDITTDDLDREFLMWVRLSRHPVKPCEDEGFESDPEPISQQFCDFSIDSIEEQITPKSPSLPCISDDELFT